MAVRAGLNTFLNLPLQVDISLCVIHSVLSKSMFVELKLFDRLLDVLMLVVLELTRVVLAHQQPAKESTTFTD